MVDSFSPEARIASLKHLLEHPVDLLIVGGGITGAGIARDAAMRGLRVGLIEQKDFAFGTSSRSSKLIHGGLRYLEQLAFLLVRQSSLERRTLRGIAPHLCEPLGFHLPLYRRDRHSLLKLRAGLFLYDGLCMYSNFDSHRILDAAGILENIPHLSAEGLRGGGFYYDALTNDARLTVTTLRSAARHGARIANYVELLDFTRGKDRIEGARVRDRITGLEGVIRARLFINATGPWVDRVRRMADSGAETWLRLSKGSHIVLKRERLCVTSAMGFANPSDGRTMFIIPWEGRTLVGTTETDYDGELEDVRPSRDDVEYLLGPLSSLFPALGIGVADVVCAYSGLRPLVGSHEGHASDASREHRVELEPGGLLTVAGGKLTTYRRMAEDVVDLALDALEPRPAAGPCRTHEVGLIEPMGPVDPAFLDELPGEARERLLHHYGSEAGDVARIAHEDPAMARFLGEAPPLLEAQIRFGVDQEMALTVEDVLVRRIPYLFTADDLGESVATRVAASMAARLAWDRTRLDRELEQFHEIMRAARPHP